MATKKSARQLRREIAYYVGVIVRTTSRDRIRLAHAAIRAREQQLHVRWDSAEAQLATWIQKQDR